MRMANENIDGGKPFDWGKTSLDHAKFRDIHPQEFYQKIVGRNLCLGGQSVLDIGTGTGILPRNMHGHGANWAAMDISGSQIGQAKLLSKDTDTDYHAISAEGMNFPDGSFDVGTRT